MLSNNHLKVSYGDKLFQAIGIPVWTENNQSGFHLPVLVFMALLLFGISRAVKLYRPRFPKILSRIVLSGIAFMLLFPIVSEKVTFMLKSNVLGIHSIDYSKKDSSCSYNWVETTVTANCKFTFYNYGDEEKIAVKPIFENIAINFEKRSLSIAPRGKVTLSAQFEGEQKTEIDYIGMMREFGVEVQIGEQIKQFY